MDEKIDSRKKLALMLACMTCLSFVSAGEKKKKKFRPNMGVEGKGEMNNKMGLAHCLNSLAS